MLSGDVGPAWPHGGPQVDSVIGHDVASPYRFKKRKEPEREDVVRAALVSRRPLVEFDVGLEPAA